MSLTLPSIARAVPGRFVIQGTAGDLQGVALSLVEIGMLREEHWRKDDIRNSVINAFNDLARRHLPDPMASFDILVVEDTVAAELEYENSVAYQEDRNLKDDVKISAVLLIFDKIQHRVIGTTIKKMEAECPGLGQTILYWLHEVFARSTRAVDPVNCIEWAKSIYWSGEDDETLKVEEEMDYLRHDFEASQKSLPKGQRKAFDEKEAAKKIVSFTRADYNRAIPPRFGSEFKFKPELNLSELARYRRGKYGKIVSATLAAAAQLRTAPPIYRLNDQNCFQSVSMDMTPYLLRWQCTPNRTRQDPMAQIFDDYMNELFQTGEIKTEVNAVFAWHDAESLRNAIKRFEIYLKLIDAAENLLWAVAPKSL